MYVAAKEVLKFRFLMKMCGTRGPWRRDEKVGLKVGLAHKEDVREFHQRKKKKKQEKKRD